MKKTIIARTLLCLVLIPLFILIICSLIYSLIYSVILLSNTPISVIFQALGFLCVLGAIALILGWAIKNS